MAEQARAMVEIRDFAGLMNNVDVDDAPPGAAEVQINACSFRVGELTIRQGMRPVVFDND